MDADLLLVEQFIKERPGQTARVLEDLNDEELTAFIEEISFEYALELISLMNIYKSAKCLKIMKPALAIELLEKNDIHKTESLLRQLDKDLRNKLLDSVSPKLSAVLRPKLEYPDHSVGALMVPPDFLLEKDRMVKDVIKILKREKRPISSEVCVVDKNGVLAGMIRLQDLFRANESSEISAIMIVEIPKFFADLPFASIKNHSGWYDYRSIPVVDGADKLIGVLNFAATRKSKIEPGRERTKQELEAGDALGELYRIGLTAFLQSVSKG